MTLLLYVYALNINSPVASRIYSYRKNPKISDTLKFAVITLNFEQDGFTKELCSQKMQRELQTVQTQIRLLLIWVYTVCLDLSVRKLGIITVIVLLCFLPNTIFIHIFNCA